MASKWDAKIWVGPGKKNYNPWKKLRFPSPLTLEKKIETLEKYLSIQPGWRRVWGEGAAPPPQMHSQNMIHDSPAVQRIWKALGS